MTEIPTTLIGDGHGGAIRVMCEFVGDHLAIVPALVGDNRLTGMWAVSHTPTRLRLPGEGACIQCARHAARLADCCGIDWAEVEGDKDWWTKERTALVQPACEALNGCWAESCRD